jgi:hypothetical protein
MDLGWPARSRAELGLQLFEMMDISEGLGSPEIRAGVMDEVDEGKVHYI